MFFTVFDSIFPASDCDNTFRRITWETDVHFELLHNLAHGLATFANDAIVDTRVNLYINGNKFVLTKK